MARRFVFSPSIAILLGFNLFTIALLLSNETARHAILTQLGAGEFLGPEHTLNHFDGPDDAFLLPPPAPKYFTRTKVVHYPKTVLATTTATETTTVTTTLTTVQTVAVSTPPSDGRPAFCDECGPGDDLCKKYGQHNLERSRAYEGPNTRLRRVLQKAADGQSINIGILGGSVSAGHGVDHQNSWTTIFFEWWKATFPHEDNVFVNGAVPAITTDYFSLCALEHIDEDVDLVIIEMVINDTRDEYFARTYERLVRLLLELPHKPAVINAHVMALAFDSISTGGDLHAGVAEYYDVPTVSLRNVALYHLLENPQLDREIFHVATPDGDADLRHIGKVGHRMLADLLIAYMQRQICAQAKLKTNPSVLEFQYPGNTVPGPAEMGEVPRLRMFQKYVHDERVPPLKTTCLSARSKKHRLEPIRQQGWSDWAWKDKAYLIAKEPGAYATFSITVGPLGLIKVTYLKSKTFGLGSVKCWVDDNEATATRIDGWWDQDGINIARDADVAGGIPAGPHEVTCRVLEETADPGRGHEFRLISLTSS